MKNKAFFLIIFILAIIIHIYFYISASSTHSLDRFFLPVTQGQDFFQIPNGARSFLQGKSLQGKERAFTSCCGVNDNVYHPLFTLMIGLPLQVLGSWTAFNLWRGLHFLSTIFLIIFLAVRFKKNKLLLPIFSLFLINNFHYYEIINNQYHFVLSLATFFLLYEVIQKKDSLVGGLFFFLSLLVKPIGIFWAIPLALGGYFKTLSIGLGFFIITTAPFKYLTWGKYYLDNLFVVVQSHYPDWNIFYIPHYFGIEIKSIFLIKAFLSITLVFLSMLKRERVFVLIGLWIIFVLMMFQSNFPYHYSILPFFLILGLISKKLNFNILLALALFFITLPAPIFVSQTHLFQKFIFLFWSNLGLILLSGSLIFNLFSVDKVDKIEERGINEN